MTQASTIRVTALKDLVPVRSPDDLDWYVKESEMITGKRGREFVVAGADRPAFRVHLDEGGYEIVRVDQADGPNEGTRATRLELPRHAVGNAMLCGLLYTMVLQ